FDLDTGQVVPEDQGGDLQFVQDDRGQVQLNALKPATIYTLSRSPLSDADEPGLPSRGRGVLPTDFSGRYRLVANGQWTGSLEIKADDQGVVQGRFRSDQTGSSYRVAGQVEPGTRNMLRFSVVLPRARMEFDGWLWTEGKGAMAGSMTLLDRTYGFFALRENSDFAPEDVRTPIDESSILVEPDLVVELRPDGSLALDGQDLTRDDLLNRLQAERARRGDFTLLLQAPDSTPYAQVADLLKALDASGIKNLRLRVAPRGTEVEP
ncbi:MAG TPA: biopolymer transporter ExbD, partial [Isosphaeraceae bacterium]|nr:biopolymer transporter ExbD [Isosphaeraceae bacterium]